MQKNESVTIKEELILEEDDVQSEAPSPTVCCGPHNRPKPQKRKSDASENLEIEVLKKVNNHIKQSSDKEDRFDTFGKNIAIRLRNLPKRLSLHIEKQINDILYQAEISEHSSGTCPT